MRAKEFPCPPLGEGLFKFNKISYGFEIEHGSMYSAPAISFRLLTALADYYGTEEIDTSSFAEGGCETCDYGSWYGQNIEVHNPTQNIPNLETNHV